MRLARVVPSDDAVLHFGEVGVSGFGRPPGGLIGSYSMQVCAIEDQPGVFVRRYGVISRHLSRSEIA
jgi:hypothetical protein